MKKGKLIGEGMTAEVFQWEDDKVLKLFFNNVPFEEIQREAEIGQIVTEVGIVAPTVYEMIELEGRWGIIFQRITGKPMLKLIETKPWRIISYGKKIARLHTEIHQSTIKKSIITKSLPLQGEKFISSIKAVDHLLGGQADLIINYLEGLPNGLKVCHGDFHPDNILQVSQDDGDFMTIDWTNIYLGNPLSDATRTYLMFRSPFVPKGMSPLTVKFISLIKRILSSTYLKEYLRLTNSNFEDFQGWILPIAAARLREEIPNEKEWLLEIIQREVERLGL